MKYSSTATYENTMENQNYYSNEEVFRREFKKTINSFNSNNYVKCLSKRGKRFRSAFTTEQVNYLEIEFRKYPYIGNARRKDVANVLNIPERAVKIWFQNRRMKEKKDGTNKEIDETKNLETSGDQLRNLSAAINENLSLPIINTSKEISNKTKLYNSTVINDGKLDLTVPRCVQSKNNFYKDITPERELTNENITLAPTNNNKSADIYKTSSIELLNKYKCEFSTQEGLQENEIDFTQEVRRPLCNELKTEQKTFIPHYPVITMPQDLSSYKKPTIAPYENPKVIPEHPQPRNLESSANNADLPLYVKGFYAQPYIPPGNMIWKPVSVAPIMSTGFSGLNLSNNTPVNMTIDQQNIPKNCNCDCHMKPYCSPILYQHTNHNPQVQYVITAVPLQNSVPKF